VSHRIGGGYLHRRRRRRRRRGQETESKSRMQFLDLPYELLRKIVICAVTAHIPTSAYIAQTCKTLADIARPIYTRGTTRRAWHHKTVARLYNSSWVKVHIERPSCGSVGCCFNDRVEEYGTTNEWAYQWRHFQLLDGHWRTTDTDEPRTKLRGLRRYVAHEIREKLPLSTVTACTPLYDDNGTVSRVYCTGDAATEDHLQETFAAVHDLVRDTWCIPHTAISYTRRYLPSISLLSGRGDTDPNVVHILGIDHHNEVSSCEQTIRGVDIRTANNPCYISFVGFAFRGAGHNLFWVDGNPTVLDTTGKVGTRGIKSFDLAAQRWRWTRILAQPFESIALHSSYNFVNCAQVAATWDGTCLYAMNLLDDYNPELGITSPYSGSVSVYCCQRHGKLWKWFRHPIASCDEGGAGGRQGHMIGAINGLEPLFMDDLNCQYWQLVPGK